MSNVESEVGSRQPSCWMQRSPHQTSTVIFVPHQVSCWDWQALL